MMIILLIRHRVGLLYHIKLVVGIMWGLRGSILGKVSILILVGIDRNLLLLLVIEVRIKILLMIGIMKLVQWVLESTILQPKMRGNFNLLIRFKVNHLILPIHPIVGLHNLLLVTIPLNKNPIIDQNIMFLTSIILRPFKLKEVSTKSKCILMLKISKT